MNAMRMTRLAGAVLALWLAALPAWAKDIRWGTSQVGSAGHRALTTLAEVLNKEWTGYTITVQPTTGAILTVKGYATEQFDGYYGSDIAFWELANDMARFQGFKNQMKRQPVQSFWTFTVEVGAGIASRDVGKLKGWGDLEGKKFFSGPRPWDTRAQFERALKVLGVKHEYVEVGIQTAGSLLDGGRLAGMTIYTNAESTTAPWITETSIQTDWAVLNPTPDEVQKLKQAGFSVIEVDATLFGRKNPAVKKATLLPFYYGFHVGLEVPADDVYRMLKIVEGRVADLAAADPSFEQIRKDMVGMQRKGVASAADLVPIHPGLARYMKEKGAWDAKWDARIAKGS
jgi:hypothetical protein